MKEKIYRFKQELNKVFDDNLHTKQWHNVVDYIIITLIIISTIEVFLSTYEGVVERFGKVLHMIDWFTTVFFTVEVSLRIWCADLLDPKYKGFWGRVRYCFSFYGLIDILSTFPFYLQFFMPFPYMVLKSLRIARLLRIFRYMKAFSLLSRAINSKKQEMIVSLQFLTIVTLILSFILFFVEHEAQPDVYTNGWKSVIWAFLQYIGDPGGFAETPPITVVGRLIACIIGILGIAIFAVPAGLIGSAFTDVMADDQHEEHIKSCVEKLKGCFQRMLDRPTQLYVVRKFVSIADVQAWQGMSEEDVFEAVNADPAFRMINLAATRTMEEHAEDKLAIEYNPINRPYGCCINRDSKITIVNMVGNIDPVVSWTAYYLALIGGFNLISRTCGQARPFKSFYQIDKDDPDPMLRMFMDDLHILAPDEDSWVIAMNAASGAAEPDHPTELHFCYGAKKGDETYDDPNITIHDIAAFDSMQKGLGELLKPLNLSHDCQRYYDNSSPRIFCRYWDYKINAVLLKTAWKVSCWDSRSLLVLQTIATALNRHILHRENPISEELTTKKVGYDITDSI